MQPPRLIEPDPPAHSGSPGPSHGSSGSILLNDRDSARSRANSLVGSSRSNRSSRPPTEHQVHMYGPSDNPDVPSHEGNGPAPSSYLSPRPVQSPSRSSRHTFPRSNSSMASLGGSSRGSYTFNIQPPSMVSQNHQHSRSSLAFAGSSQPGPSTWAIGITRDRSPRGRAPRIVNTVSEDVRLSGESENTGPPIPITAHPLQASGAPPFGQVSDPPFVFPMVPGWTSRYERKADRSKDISQLAIPPFTLSFRRGHIGKWQAFIHPEGNLYFYHPEKRVLTEANLYHSGTLKLVGETADRILDLAAGRSIPTGREDSVLDAEVNSSEAAVDSPGAVPSRIAVPSELLSKAELVLEIFGPVPEDGAVGQDISIGYYFVDHDTRSLFWPSEFSAGNSLCLLQEVKGVTKVEQIQELMDAHYWMHWEYFPKCRRVTLSMTQELRDILVHGIADLMTSTTSTAPYSVAEMNNMLTLVQHMKDAALEAETTPEKFNAGRLACSFGRIMSQFAHSRFLDFHGQEGARLDRDASVYGDDVQRTWLIAIVSPFLFFAPDMILHDFEHLWVDSILALRSWEAFRPKLSGNWQEFTISGTVLLAVNVSFLAIASVDGGMSQAGAKATHSAIQMLSYASTLASTGSIFMSLQVARKNYRVKAYDSTERATAFIQKINHPTYGFEIQAIVLSLPFALLLWGTIFFLAAFSMMGVYHTNRDTWIPYLVGLFLALTPVALAVYLDWKSGDHIRRRFVMGFVGNFSAACRKMFQKMRFAEGRRTKPPPAGAIPLTPMAVV